MMDPLEWIISLGNINVAIYLNQSLGWVYGLVKMIIYSVIIFFIVRKLYLAYKFNYLVSVSVVGPEKTITEVMDRGSLTKNKKNVIEFRLRKRGKMSFIPERKHITPLYSRWWWQPSGSIKLYQFGSSNYSVTPIGTNLSIVSKLKGVVNKKTKDANDKIQEENNKDFSLYDSKIDVLNIKFNPVEPELGAIAQSIKEGLSTLDKDPWYRTLAPIVGALIPFLIFGILLFFISGQFVESAATNAQASQVIATALDKLVDNGVIEQSALDAPTQTEPKTNEAIGNNNAILDDITKGGIPW